MVRNIAIGSAALFGGSYLYTLYQASEKMQINIELSVKRKTTSFVLIRASVQIKNPTEASIAIKYPFVVLSTGEGENESVLGSSAAKDKVITIPSNGHTSTFNIDIEIPSQNLIKNLGFNLFNLLSNPNHQQAFSINTLTHSGIPFLFGLRSFSFSHKEQINITI